MAPGILLPYWRRAARRALWDTWKLFGLDRRKVLVGPFLFALGSLVHLRRAGIDAMWNEISVTLSYGVYGVGLGAIGLYLWNLLFVAPARMDQDAARKAGGERDALLRLANDLRDQLMADAEARTALPVSVSVRRITSSAEKNIEESKFASLSAICFLEVSITNSSARKVSLDCTIDILFKDERTGTVHALYHLDTVWFRQLQNEIYEGYEAVFRSWGAPDLPSLIAPFEVQPDSTVTGNLMFLAPKSRFLAHGLLKDAERIELILYDRVSGTIARADVSGARH